MARVTIVSGDGHASPPLIELRDYVDPQYTGAFDEFVEEEDNTYRNVFSGPAYPKPDAVQIFDKDGRFTAGGETGGYDWQVRQKEMDAEGCVCEIVHSGTQAAPTLWYGIVNRPRPAELRAAGAKAYHRWLADMMAQSDGRMLGVAEPGPCLDMDATVKELRWLTDNRFVSVGVPGISADPALPPLYDRYYEPFWSACEELGLVLSVHAGWGQAQGTFYEFFDKMMGPNGNLEGLREFREQLIDSDNSPLFLDLGPRRVMWQLMLGGVFDRHPNLRLAITEVRAGWVPPTLAELDRQAESLATPLKRKPSEYFAEHCAVTPSSIQRQEVELRHQIGLGQLIFGIDYPHYEGTWPNTQDWIRAAFAGVPENEARAILGGNAIDFYRLDRVRLDALAAKIGPEPRDVFLSAANVDPQLIGHFDTRAQFTSTSAPVDLPMIGAAFAEDVEGAIGVHA